MESVWKTITDAGNPEGLDYDEARETLARGLTTVGSKTFTTTAPLRHRVRKEEAEVPEEQLPRSHDLSIPEGNGTPYWWDDPADARFLDWYVMARRKLGGKMHGGMVITGPAGSGKSAGVPVAIQRINDTHKTDIRLFKMDCTTVTDESKWFGRREVDKDGTHYHPSDFVLAVERGDAILLDEIGRLHPRLHNPVMALFDGFEAVNLSDLNYTVKRHPETVFIATTNIGVQYGGTYRMDWAMRERFPYTIERDFPPEAEEIKVLTSHTGCDADGASVLVQIADRTREMYRTGDIRSPISTRELVAAAWLIASGMDEREALERTAIPLFDGDASGVVGAESDRQKVAGIIEGRLGHKR
jgi:MoxR-like ATPase